MQCAHGAVDPEIENCSMRTRFCQWKEVQNSEHLRRTGASEACAGNKSHLKETMSLLAAYEASDGFMDEPATLNVIATWTRDLCTAERRESLLLVRSSLSRVCEWVWCTVGARLAHGVWCWLCVWV